jgi:uncharacterized protein
MDMGINTFSWQGGEPTLMGLPFFEKVVSIQLKHSSPGMLIANALQTNGTLLDPAWAAFLAEYKFLVGLSIDGPALLHDHYRKDISGRGTFKRVIKAAELLMAYGVETNALVLLNNINIREPETVYEFLKSAGFHFMQFIPCVEPGRKDTAAPFSVNPSEYGDFLIRIFDLWAADFPGISVRDFDDLLLHELGKSPMTCTTNDLCGDYVVIEHNGDVYACDFLVTKEWRLGNILEQPLEAIISSDRFSSFCSRKADLGRICRQCPFLALCHGGCQRHRTALGGDITDPSYFCRAYRRLFAHAEVRIPELAIRIRL